jgi:hypothetical protein
MLIEKMVSMVRGGMDPRSVMEHMVTYSPGMSLKVNKATTGTEDGTGSFVPVAQGTVVSVILAGAGNSGADPLVLLPDGRKVVLPFMDVFESISRRKNRMSEQLTDVYATVTLTKPIPSGLISCLSGGQLQGVTLPEHPLTDTDTNLSFLMRACTQGEMDAAIECIKVQAGTSFESSASAVADDWISATAPKLATV